MLYVAVYRPVNIGHGSLLPSQEQVEDQTHVILKQAMEDILWNMVLYPELAVAMNPREELQVTLIYRRTRPSLC